MRNRGSVSLSPFVTGIFFKVRVRARARKGHPGVAIFHGYAYGESIYGAEPTPLAAYLAGLVTVQTALVLGVALASRTVWKLSGIAPRLAGAAICGVGFTVLVTQLVPAP